MRLIKFSPDLIVTDLLIGQTREDGYKLLKDINRVAETEQVPIVVCSKLINNSPPGQKNKRIA